MQTATSQIFLDLLTLKLELKTEFFFVYIKTTLKKKTLKEQLNHTMDHDE